MLCAFTLIQKIVFILYIKSLYQAPQFQSPKHSESSVDTTTYTTFPQPQTTIAKSNYINHICKMPYGNSTNYSSGSSGSNSGSTDQSSGAHSTTQPLDPKTGGLMGTNYTLTSMPGGNSATKSSLQPPYTK
jgi:hypothetical protein